jgi:hypothetical protein
MDTASLVPPGRGAQVLATTRWTSGVTRARLEELLSQWLSPACTSRLWSETWGQAHVTPFSLWAWFRLYGAEIAALAVAAGLSEAEVRCHLEDRRRPDRGILEMLADLNCFPYLTPATRPLLGL